MNVTHSSSPGARLLATSIEYLLSVLLATLSLSAARATGLIPQGIQHDLGPQLSSKALIVLPSSPQFAALNKRWENGGRPTYSVIVVPATEEDVSESVKYANKHKLPFIAIVGGHGTWRGMDKMKDGIGIYLRNLSIIKVNPDGKSAILGGGLRVADVIEGLWKKGKQTVTGSCNCVGAVAPALGGGHGNMQGQYGLAADQLLSARVVLGNGEIITVSEHSHKDLFWGLRGAGHNFGIVTEMKYKVYDVKQPVWSHIYITFQGDQIEEVYPVFNRMMDTQPAHAVLWTNWFKDPTLDPNHPVINSSIVFNGPLSSLLEYANPLLALRNIGTYAQTSDYLGLSKILGLRTTDYFCQNLGNVGMWPSDVKEYKVPAIRKWYDIFDHMVNTEAVLSGSVTMLEQYSTQAVVAVPDASTAFAGRKERLLLLCVYLVFFSPARTL